MDDKKEEKSKISRGFDQAGSLVTKIAWIAIFAALVLWVIPSKNEPTHYGQSQQTNHK